MITVKGKSKQECEQGFEMIDNICDIELKELPTVPK